MANSDSLVIKLLSSSKSSKSDNPGDELKESLEKILTDAFNDKVSDVHFDPRESFLEIRRRVDGELSSYHKLPVDSGQELIEYIRNLSGIGNSPFLPGNGKIIFSSDDQGDILIEVFTTPVASGQRAVLRFMDSKAEVLDFISLGLWGYNLINLDRIIAKPYGLVLISGPVNSGKSSLSRSILNRLYSPRVSLATIEDPIKQKLEGINQTAVDNSRGMTFALGLKAIVNQHPDVIYVSRIENQEAADICIQAAHKSLVIGGSLAPNMGTAIKRLISMKVSPSGIGASLSGLVALRTVRKLCLACAEQISPSSTLLNQLKKDFGLKDFKVINKLEKMAANEGLNPISQPLTNSSEFTISRLWQASDKGCSQCNYKGFKGRIGLQEVLENNQAVTDKILSKDELKIRANIPLKIDGLVKALMGLTTTQEVLKVSSDA